MLVATDWLVGWHLALFPASTITYALAGLDARAAAIVMRAVRNTVDTGRTVVCTIHQPSIDVFEVPLLPVTKLLRGRLQCTLTYPCFAEVQGSCQLAVLAVLLQSFDELLLMKRGGRIIFNGPLGTRSSDLISFFLVRSHKTMCSDDAPDRCEWH